MGNWKDILKRDYKIRKDSKGNEEWYNVDTNLSIREEMENTIKNAENLIVTFYYLRDVVDDEDLMDKSINIASEYYYLDHVAETLYDVKDEVKVVYFDGDGLSMDSKLDMWLDMTPCEVLMTSVYNHIKDLDKYITEYRTVPVAGGYKSLKDIVDKTEEKYKKKGDKK